MAVVDQLVLLDDPPEQALVCRTDKAVSRKVDLREEPPRKGNECPLANVDEKWRLIARLAGPGRLDLDYTDRRGVTEFFDLRGCVHPHDQAPA